VRAIIAVVLALAAGVAGADPDAARAHFDRGQELVRAGDYRQARDEFSQSFELSAHPAFLFNMAECSRKLGETAAARAQYERYIALELDLKLRAIARDRLAGLPADPPVVAISTPTAVMPVDVRAAPDRPSALPALITGAGGIALLTATSVLAMHARNQWSDAQRYCIDARCTAAGVTLAGDARQAANWATALGVAGASAVVVAGYLWWRDRHHRRPGGGS